ncbi:MAG: ATP-binding protein [Chitinivibrionales bacterium]|nr:ATP-binding protein [Chitinivibrionales bacterium]
MTDSTTPAAISLAFPGDLEYIPAVRKFIAEAVASFGFNPKFVYRCEVIVDELCNNAVTYGCVSVTAAVKLTCRLFRDRAELAISDEGGKKENIVKLEQALKDSDAADRRQAVDKKNLGMEIVRLLAEKVDLHIDETRGVTTVKVIKKCEETR